MTEYPPVVIAQQPSAIVTDPRKYWLTVHGDQGVGKTTFASQIPGHYFLCTEEGLPGLSAYKSSVFNWAHFVAIVNKIVLDKERSWEDVDGNPLRPITTLVIDVYEKLWDMLGKYVCDKQKFLVDGRPQSFDRVDDVPWGKAYKRVNGIIIPLLEEVMRRGFGLVTICHTKVSDVKWSGEMVQKYHLNLSDKSEAALKSASSAIGYFTVKEKIGKKDSIVTSVETARVAYWQPTFFRVAKHRLKGFPEQIILKRDTQWQDYVKIFQTVSEAASANGIKMESENPVLPD